MRHILTPEEWNSVVDALDELNARAPLEIKGGLASFTGDGSTITFKISHGLSGAPSVALVGKASSGLPDIDHYTADTKYINVTFKSPPSSGVEVKLWWLALRL